MEPAEKKIKLNDGEPSKIQHSTAFLDMNDDCIFEILKMLPLADLYSVGSTCHRINQMAGDIFERKHSDEWINISIKSKPKKLIVFEHPNKYAHNFGKYFRSIIVGPSNRSIGQPRIFQFIQSMCCPNLKRLKMNRLYGELKAEHGKLIENQLADLQSIQINDFRVDGDIYNAILQYCKIIKWLSIHTDRDANADWMIQSYPKLESLEIYFADKRHQDKFSRNFKEFCGKNPQLNMVSCSQAYVMQSVILSVTFLPYLKLQFDRHADVIRFFLDLWIRSEHEKIGQLKIIMPKWMNGRAIEYDMDLFAVLPLVSLHNIHLVIPENILSMQRMVNLRELSLDLYCTQNELMEVLRMFSELPELVALDLKYHWRTPVNQNLTFERLCLLFVVNSPKMAILKINVPQFRLDNNQWDLSHVVPLNFARSVVRDAIPMTIHIKALDIQYLANTLCRNPVCKMVKISLETIVSENKYRRRRRRLQHTA